jgi:hypothetical protein
LKGESLDIASLKTPDTGSVEKSEDIEGAVLEKAHLYQRAVQLVEVLFQAFITSRVSSEWNEAIVPRIKAWIHES